MLLEICATIVGLIIIFKCIDNLFPAKNFPPGPSFLSCLPILGHLWLLGSKPYVAISQWKKKYGPIVYCQFGSYPVVVLSDAKLIKQAFNMPEMNGRALFKPFKEGTNGKGIIFVDGYHNQEQRQFVLRNLKDYGMTKNSIESSIQDGLLKFLEKIKNTKETPVKSSHIVTSSIISTLWTIMMTEHLPTDSYNILGDIVAQKINQLGPIIAQLAFFNPWMENLSKILTFGRSSILKFKVDGFKELHSFMRKEIDKRKNTWTKQEPRDFLDAYLDKMEETKDEKSSFHKKHQVDEIAFGDLIIGAVDSTATTLEWLFNYMARNPEIQEKLQHEIDTVVGIGVGCNCNSSSFPSSSHSDSETETGSHSSADVSSCSCSCSCSGVSRFPSLSDKPQMPYTDAVMYEILRISSLAPFGVPHRTLVDVTDFQGYHIPKDTLIFPHLYGVHHDEEVWGDPDNFRPERWLVSSEEVKELKGVHFQPFSQGKRSCPGEILARQQLFLYIATIFQRFTVSFAGDKIPPIEPVLGVGIAPAPFQIIFKARGNSVCCQKRGSRQSSEEEGEEKKTGATERMESRFIPKITVDAA